jgi:ABC-type uncharacterized transport system permease subunit
MYFLGGLVLIGLLGILTMQELRYKDTLLTLQATENSLSGVSQELLQASLELEASKAELERQIAIANKSQRVAKDVAVQVNILRGENTTLKQIINVLKKENEDVKEYLNSNVPDSISNSLRE